MAASKDIAPQLDEIRQSIEMLTNQVKGLEQLGRMEGDVRRLAGQMRSVERRLAGVGIPGGNLGVRHPLGRDPIFEIVDLKELLKRRSKAVEDLIEQERQRFIEILNRMKGSPIWLGGEGTGATGPTPPDGGPVGNVWWSMVDKWPGASLAHGEFHDFEWKWGSLGKPTDGPLDISIEVFGTGVVQLWLAANHSACACVGQDGGTYVEGSPPEVHTVDLSAFDWKNNGEDVLHGRVTFSGDVENFKFSSGLPDQA